MKWQSGPKHTNAKPFFSLQNSPVSVTFTKCQVEARWAESLITLEASDPGVQMLLTGLGGWCTGAERINELIWLSPPINTYSIFHFVLTFLWMGGVPACAEASPAELTLCCPGPDRFIIFLTLANFPLQQRELWGTRRTAFSEEQI